MTHFPASTAPEDVIGYTPVPGDRWDHPGYSGARFWRRGDGNWYLDQRKDEDPRHVVLLNGGWRDCDRCESSVYDRATLGIPEDVCPGERRKRDVWVPGEPLQQQEDWP